MFPALDSDFAITYRENTSPNADLFLYFNNFNQAFVGGF